jgi:ATP phosphoribosyltransferase
MNKFRKNPKLNFVFSSSTGLKNQILDFLEVGGGWELPGLRNGKFSEIPENDSEIRFNVRATRDIAKAVLEGSYDAGITGKDYMTEDGFSSNSNLIVVDEFGFSRKTYKPSRLVLAGKVQEGQTLKDVYQDLERPIRIGTELPKLTRECIAQLLKDNSEDFPRLSLDSFNAIFSNGTEEGMIENGDADFVATVTETGKSLREARLTEMDELFISPMQIVIRSDVLQDYDKLKLLEQIRASIQARLIALRDRYVLATMNAPWESCENIMKLIDSMDEPTICELRSPRLFDQRRVSLAAGMPKMKLTKIAPDLLDLGANGIIDNPLDRVFFAVSRSPVIQKAFRDIISEMD